MRAPATIVLSLLVISLTADAAGPGPIVAVFEIEAQGAGRFRTVPRSQIKQRLTDLRKESYRDCYDQACQIEIGRELAASKALSTRVIAAGDRCELTVELFDLRSATTEAAHTASGACEASTLFDTVSAAVEALVRKVPSPTSAPDAPSSAAAAEDKVSLYVRSVPVGAEVLIDGLSRGITPLHLPVARGRRLKLVLRGEGYQAEQRTVIAKDLTEVEVPLRLTPEGRYELAATSEWLGLGFGAGHADRLDTAFALQVRMAQIKGRHFFWTLFEANMIMVTGTAEGDNSGSVNLGTRAGYPLYLGARGQHQLLFGLGLGYAKIFEDTAGKNIGREAFALSPGVDYTYNAYDGLVPVGLGLRLTLPAAGDFDDDYPWAMAATANIGISIYRLFKGVARRTKPGKKWNAR
jgi:hypothetical protein